MEVWMIIFIVALIILILAIIIFGIFQYFKSEPVLEENDFILSFMAHKHENRCFGRVEFVETGPDNQKIITMKPQDLSLKEITDDEKIPSVKIIVNKGKLISFPKGFLSKGRYIDIALPPKAEDFPPELIDTPFGRMLQFYVELDNAKNTDVESLRNGIESMQMIINKMSGGEASKEMLQHMMGYFKDVLQLQLETKKDKTGTSITPSFGQHSV